MKLADAAKADKITLDSKSHHYTMQALVKLVMAELWKEVVVLCRSSYFCSFSARSPLLDHLHLNITMPFFPPYQQNT